MSKSYIKPTPRYEGAGPRPPDLVPCEFSRLVLDHGELVQAVRDDDVTGLVRRTLRPTYGGLKTFEAVVDAAARTVRYGVAAAVSSYRPGASYALLLSDTTIAGDERRSQDGPDAVTPPHDVLWVGEGGK